MIFKPFGKRTDFKATSGTIRVAFIKFHQPLFYFAFQQLQNKARAEDAVSMAFVECWRSLTASSELKAIEEELYEQVQYYCSRHLNQIYRDRVLLDMFGSKVSDEELALKKIESITVQYLVKQAN